MISTMIMGVIADQGNGKTAFITAMAYGEHINYKRKVIANYNLKFNNLYLDFEAMITMLDTGEMPDAVADSKGKMVPFKKLVKRKFGFTPKSVDQIFQNAVVLADEIHVAAHAYRFLSKESRVMANFISQIRKRNILFMYTSQRNRKIAIGIRDETTYISLIHKTEMKNVIKIELCNPRDNQETINVRYMDISYVYGMYDTNQIIRYSTAKIYDGTTKNKNSKTKSDEKSVKRVKIKKKGE